MTSVVISPFLDALGAGLGRAEADPIVSVSTVPRELNPTPVIVTVSSTAASAGSSVIDGFGVEQSAQFGLEFAEHAPALDILAEVL